MSSTNETQGICNLEGECVIEGEGLEASGSRALVKGGIILMKQQRKTEESQGQDSGRDTVSLGDVRIDPCSFELSGGGGQYRGCWNVHNIVSAAKLDLAEHETNIISTLTAQFGRGLREYYSSVQPITAGILHVLSASIRPNC
ncbi:hypothetical protein B0H14DRAFT_2556129 [Mycena olivaceomarginata]|nr:hypothetical protein B0H14DRAFT_2556129 [Mycena olivaceomarginata]